MVTGNYSVPLDHDVIDAGSGNDFVGAGTGRDIVHGGDGDDDIWGLGGDDILYGDSGDDWIRGDGYLQRTQSTDGSLYTPAEFVGNDLLFGGAVIATFDAQRVRGANATLFVDSCAQVTHNRFSANEQGFRDVA